MSRPVAVLGGGAIGGGLGIGLGRPTAGQILSGAVLGAAGGGVGGRIARPAVNTLGTAIDDLMKPLLPGELLGLVVGTLTERLFPSLGEGDSDQGN